MHNFVAIDFETANRRRNSACSIGLAVVTNGKITDTYSSLIQPPEMAFDDDLTGIHGITPDAVRDAPTFADIWPEVQQRCGCGLVVAHNAAFDVGVICACETDSHHRWLPDQYLCTVRASKAVLPGLPNHKLGTLANLFGIQLQHHDAMSDAIACAEIALRLFRLGGDDLLRHQSRDIADFGSNTQNDGQFSGAAVRFSINDLDKEIVDSLVATDAGDGRFEGQAFVFTGELAYLGRKEANQIVEQHGGRSTSSVSKKTNVVVVGDEVLHAYRQTGHTTGKLGTAVQLQSQGVDISIISESEFLTMIGDNRAQDQDKPIK